MSLMKTIVNENNILGSSLNILPALHFCFSFIFTAHNVCPTVLNVLKQLTKTTNKQKRISTWKSWLCWVKLGLTPFRTNTVMLRSCYGAQLTYTHFHGSEAIRIGFKIDLEYKWKRCSKKKCCKQCGQVKLMGTMTKWHHKTRSMQRRSRH